MAVGKNIKKFAQEKGVSLRQVALDAGISYNTLYAIVKRDSNRIDLKTLQNIAKALNVTVNDLNPSYMSPEERKVAIQTAEANKPSEQQIETMIESVAKAITDPDVYKNMSEQAMKAVEKLGITGDILRMYSPDSLDKRLLKAFQALNKFGQQKAVERVEELTEIPKYQKKDEADTK